MLLHYLYFVLLHSLLRISLQVLADHKDAVFILISVFIIFCTTATLCLVFVPKVNKRNYCYCLISSSFRY